MKKDMIDKLESNRPPYPMQEKCLGHFLSDGEKAYLFPLIAAWAGSDEQAFDWLVHERLSACNNQTPLQRTMTVEFVNMSLGWSVNTKWE